MPVSGRALGGLTVSVWQGTTVSVCGVGCIPSAVSELVLTGAELSTGSRKREGLLVVAAPRADRGPNLPCLSGLAPGKEVAGQNDGEGGGRSEGGFQDQGCIIA